VSSSGAYAVAVDRRVMWWDGAVWQFQLLPKEQAVVGVVDMWWAENDLWIKYLDSPTSDPQEYSTYRILGALGGARTLQRLSFSAGDVDDLQLIDATAATQGALVLRTTPSSKFGQNLVCRVEAVGEVAPLLTGTPTTFEAGRLYLHARRGRWSDMFDRMALQDDGQAYIASWRDFVGGVPPNNVLWNVQETYGDTATISGVTSNDGLKLLVNAFGERTDVPDLHVLDVAPGLGLPFSDTVFSTAPRDGFAAQPFGWVSAVSSIDDQLLYATTLGTWPSRAKSWRPEGRRAIPGIAVSTAFGMALTKSTVGPAVQPDGDGISWVTGIGLVPLLDGSLPEANPCGVVAVEGADCLVYPGEATAMSMDMDGFVYVVDGPRGQVLRKKVGDAAWSLVASHLMHPADIAIRQVNGHTLVYILDGDIWVFEPSSQVAMRQSAASMAPYDVALADPAESVVDDASIVRPTAACEQGAPCFSPPIWSDTSFPWKDLDGWAVLAGQTVCLSGQDFGQSGTLYLTGVVVPTTSWSASSLCFESSAAPQQPKRGALWIVRDDQVPSHVLPYIVDPESGPGVTSFRVDTPLPSGVTPRIATACRSSIDQGCTVAIVGPLSLTPSATIDGMPAAISGQNQGNITLAWPDGLVAGEYELVLDGLTKIVELVDFDKESLSELAVDQIGIPRHDQAITTAFGETYGVFRSGQYGSPNGVRTPSASVVEVRNLSSGAHPGMPDDQFSQEVDLPRLVPHDGALFAVVRRASYVRELSGNGVVVLNDYQITEPVTAGLYRLDAGANAFVALPDTSMPGSTTGRIVGAVSTARGLVVVLYDEVAKTVMAQVWDGAAWSQDAPISLEVLETRVSGSRLFVHSPNGIFSLDLEDSSLLGPFVPPGSRLMTFGADGGDVLVVVESAGEAQIQRLNLGTGAFELIVALPDVPGVGLTTPPNRASAMEGVSAVSGDRASIWVAIADRDTASATAGLRLLRYQAGQWFESGEIAGSVEASVCLGPIRTSEVAGFCSTTETFQGGCTMFACQHGTGGFVPRSAWADTVSLTPIGGKVVAAFESIYGGYSLEGSGYGQFVTW